MWTVFKTVFKNFYLRLVYSVLYKISDLGKPFIIIPVFLSHYGTESYGLYAQIILLASLVYPIVDLGIGYSSQRFFHDYSRVNILQAVLSVEFFFSILSLLILFFLFECFNGFYTLIFGSTDNIILVISVLIYILLFSFSYTYIGIYRALSKFKSLVTIKISIDLLEITLIVSWILHSASFNEIYIFILIFDKLLFLIILVTKSGVTPKFSKEVFYQHKTEISNFFKYSLLIIPVSFVGFLNSSSDKLFISHFFGLKYVGLYSVAYQYISYITLIAFPFTFIYFSVLSKYYDNKDRKKFLLTIKRIFLFVIVFTVAFVIVFFVIRRFIYTSFLGLKIDKAFSQVIIFSLITVLFLNIISIQSMILNILKKNKQVLFLLLVTASLNIILNGLFIHSVGYYFAAISTTVCTLLLFCLQLFYLFKYKSLLYAK